MNLFETNVDMAWRHVVKPERQLHRQRALVAGLDKVGRNVEAAEKTLAVFEASLDAVRQHVVLEETLAHTPRWNKLAARTPVDAAFGRR